MWAMAIRLIATHVSMMVSRSLMPGMGVDSWGESPLQEDHRQPCWRQLLAQGKGQPARGGLKEAGGKTASRGIRTPEVSRHPRGESAQRDEALWSGGHGKWRGCAAIAHVLIRGDLLDEQPPATGAGLRPRPKGRADPPDPTVALAAHLGAIRAVIEQKSAEAILGVRLGSKSAPKGRTW